MHRKRNAAVPSPSPNEAEDRKAQRIVLIQVLELHPTQLRIPDLVRSIAAGAGEFAETDAIERAIRDLTCTGLLACPGGVVTATPAALDADRLGVL